MVSALARAPEPDQAVLAPDQVPVMAPELAPVSAPVTAWEPVLAQVRRCLSDCRLCSSARSDCSHMPRRKRTR